MVPLHSRIKKAIESALSSTISAYYPVSELPRNPIKGKDVILSDDATTFVTEWFADGECYGRFDPEEANQIKEEMCQELATQLDSRNLVTEITGKVVQEFTWNHQYYDLNNHGVNWLVILEGRITERRGTIYKNEDDHSGQALDDVITSLGDKIL